MTEVRRVCLPLSMRPTLCWTRLTGLGYTRHAESSAARNLAMLQQSQKKQLALDRAKTLDVGPFFQRWNACRYPSMSR